MLSTKVELAILGHGVNSISKALTHRVIATPSEDIALDTDSKQAERKKGPTKKNILVEKISDQRILSDTNLFDSLTELQKEFDGSLSAKASSTQTQIKINFSSIHKQSSQELYYTLHLRSIEKTHFLSDQYQLTESVKKALKQVTDLESLEIFFNHYGDAFIDSITYGRWVLVIIQFRISSNEHKRKLAAELNQGSPYVEVGASISASLQKKISSENYTIHIYTGGIDYNAPKRLSDVGVIDQLIESFTVQDQEASPVQVDWTFRPFSTIVNNDKHETNIACILDDFVSSFRSLNSTIKKCHKWVILCLQMLNFSKMDQNILFEALDEQKNEGFKKHTPNISEIINNISNFYTRLMFRSKNGRLNNILNTILKEFEEGIAKIIHLDNDSETSELIYFANLVFLLKGMEGLLAKVDIFTARPCFKIEELDQYLSLIQVVKETLKLFDFLSDTWKEAILPVLRVDSNIIHNISHKRGEFLFNLNVPDNSDWFMMKVKLIRINTEGEKEVSTPARNPGGTPKISGQKPGKPVSETTPLPNPGVPKNSSTEKNSEVTIGDGMKTKSPSSGQLITPQSRSKMDSTPADKIGSLPDNSGLHPGVPKNSSTEKNNEETIGDGMKTKSPSSEQLITPQSRSKMGSTQADKVSSSPDNSGLPKDLPAVKNSQKITVSPMKAKSSPQSPSPSSHRLVSDFQVNIKTLPFHIILKQKYENKGSEKIGRIKSGKEESRVIPIYQKLSNLYVKPRIPVFKKGYVVHNWFKKKLGHDYHYIIDFYVHFNLNLSICKQIISIDVELLSLDSIERSFREMEKKLSSQGEKFQFTSQNNEASRLKNLLLLGDDRCLAKNGMERTYRYSITDFYSLMNIVRKSYLNYFLKGDSGEEYGAPGGELHSAYRENQQGIFVANPYVHIDVCTVKGVLDKDIAVIAGTQETADGNKPWMSMPRYLFFAFLYYSHWRLVCIEIDYSRNNYLLRWDDPFGKEHFSPKLYGEILTGIEDNIKKLFKVSQAKLKKTPVIKFFDQQGLGLNGHDCGPIVVQNLRDYLIYIKKNKSLSEFQETEYTIPAASSKEWKESIEKIRSQDFKEADGKETFPNKKTSKLLGSRLVEQRQALNQYCLNRKAELLKTPSLTLELTSAINNLDVSQLSTLFALMDNKRILDKASPELPQSRDEIQYAYTCLTTDKSLSPIPKPKDSQPGFTFTSTKNSSPKTENGHQSKGNKPPHGLTRSSSENLLLKR